MMTAAPTRGAAMAPGPAAAPQRQLGGQPPHVRGAGSLDQPTPGLGRGAWPGGSARGGGVGAGAGQEPAAAVAAVLVAALLAGSGRRREKKRAPAVALAARGGQKVVPRAVDGGPHATEPAVELRWLLAQAVERRQPQGGCPPQEAAAAKRVVRATLARLLSASATERTFQACYQQHLPAALEQEGAARGAVSAAVRQLVEESLRWYHMLEDPRGASAACVELEFLVAVPGDASWPTARCLASIDRVDMRLHGRSRVLTLVDYAVGPVDDAEEEWLRLGAQAWALRQCGQFAWDELRVRRLGLAEGGCQERALGDEDFQRAERAVREALLAHRSGGLAAAPCARAPGERPAAAGAREAEGRFEAGAAQGAAPARPAASQHPGWRPSACGDCQQQEADPVAATRGTTVVRTVDQAAAAVEKLCSLTDRIHAVDTEVRGWSPGQTPYGNGEVICFSVYCGDDVDFGDGPRLWVDNLCENGHSRDLLWRFRDYFENPKIRKVFHNYAFDRAMFVNEGLSVAGFAGDTMHMARLEHSDRQVYSLEGLGEELLGEAWRKRALREFMAEEKLRSVDDLHLSPKDEVREEWIDYSTFDTVATWKLHECLERRLRRMPWHGGCMLDFYETYWRPFAEVLVDIEACGIPIDTAQLQEQERRARQDVDLCHKRFQEWIRAEYLEKYPSKQELQNAPEQINLQSSRQMQHLLFGKGVETFGSTAIGGLGLPETLCRTRTATGGLSLSGETILKLSGSNPESGEQGCGTALPFLGVRGCTGLSMINKAKDIEKNINTFLLPLQKHVDRQGRVHTSLKLNTNTGRLASSEPNLQQLPALDKDVYKIRQAVKCADDRLFIVADYGQLELRVLAHMSGSKQMIHALCSGIDIHSATALNMYSHVKAAVDRKEVCLNGGGGVPLLKDVFGSERRCAKAVNFGIAYGMTEHGLSLNLNCDLEEAKQMIAKWYEAYPEVRTWQENVKLEAIGQAEQSGSDLAYVRTLRGRPRPLPVAHLRPRGKRAWSKSAESRDQDSGTSRTVRGPARVALLALTAWRLVCRL
ncbi:unnamed protein product [Prorocentrum cordatum]|uniref:DNA-directed DNA polymerase family A palm domain-containing protein n=1 Tax=Prorocentrum cordatum TaxID=2364126 RepID=A0ABN9XVW2_9DINO|nr:unnamed protein product [Polarella glacialis]